MSLKKSDIAAAIGENSEATFVVGENVIIRTVTYFTLGKIARISTIGNNTFLHIEDACWIPDTPYWENFIEKGELKEVEVVSCPVRVNVNAIVDVHSWNHPLPRASKR